MPMRGPPEKRKRAAVSPAHALSEADRQGSRIEAEANLAEIANQARIVLRLAEQYRLSVLHAVTVCRLAGLGGSL